MNLLKFRDLNFIIQQKMLRNFTEYSAIAGKKIRKRVPLALAGTFLSIDMIGFLGEPA